MLPYQKTQTCKNCNNRTNIGGRGVVGNAVDCVSEPIVGRTVNRSGKSPYSGVVFIALLHQGIEIRIHLRGANRCVCGECIWDADVISHSEMAEQHQTGMDVEASWGYRIVGFYVTGVTPYQSAFFGVNFCRLFGATPFNRSFYGPLLLRHPAVLCGRE